MMNSWMMVGDWGTMPMNRRIPQSVVDANRRFALREEWREMVEGDYDQLVENKEFVRQVLEWPADSFQRVEVDKARRRARNRPG